MTIVHDVVVHINDLIVDDTQNLLDDVDSHVDAGAEAAGIGEHDSHRSFRFRTSIARS
jgi:hypothetical protein